MTGRCFGLKQDIESSARPGSGEPLAGGFPNITRKSVSA